jgi:hypothetical protein
MLSDIHLVLAWFGFIFLMLLFKLPWFLTDGKTRSSRRLHPSHLFAHELFLRLWHRQ